MKKVLFFLGLVTILWAFQVQAAVYDQDLYNQLPGVWKFTTSDGRTGNIIFPAKLWESGSHVPATIVFGGTGKSFTWGFRVPDSNRNWIDGNLSSPLPALPKVTKFLLIFKKDAAGKWIFSGNFYDTNISITYGSKN
ncbi:MAG: hypothetical protein WCO53_06795 [Deltaproteobacteria bacterium]